jgi:hypothetical protein
MVWAIAFAFCWNPDNAHKTEHRAFWRKGYRLSPAPPKHSQMRNFAG